MAHHSEKGRRKNNHQQTESVKYVLKRITLTSPNNKNKAPITKHEQNISIQMIMWQHQVVKWFRTTKKNKSRFVAEMIALCVCVRFYSLVQFRMSKLFLWYYQEIHQKTSSFSGYQIIFAEESVKNNVLVVVFFLCWVCFIY